MQFNWTPLKYHHSKQTPKELGKLKTGPWILLMKCVQCSKWATHLQLALVLTNAVEDDEKYMYVFLRHCTFSKSSSDARVHVLLLSKWEY